MRRPLISVIFALLVFSGCAAHWTARPKNVPTERRCQPLGGFPQLIEIPGFISAWQLVHECDSRPAEKTAIAMNVFLQEWEEEFGRSRDVRSNIHSLLIEWGRQKKGGSGYSGDGTYMHGATYSGLTITKGTVWVKIRSGELICESSLIHELAHASIWAIKGTDGDPDHLGNKYHGWTSSTLMVIQNTNEKLCRLGI